VSSKELPTPLEKILGTMLGYGTAIASLLIALGLIVAMLSSAAGTRMAAAGIALFIALPVARVATMLVFFWAARDYRFSGIAALVLGIICCSYLVGAHWL
jgi:uncharacterized membrane protein